jgi:hypothetical protein
MLGTVTDNPLIISDLTRDSHVKLNALPCSHLATSIWRDGYQLPFKLVPTDLYLVFHCGAQLDVSLLHFGFFFTWHCTVFLSTIRDMSKSTTTLISGGQISSEGNAVNDCLEEWGELYVLIEAI